MITIKGDEAVREEMFNDILAVASKHSITPERISQEELQFNKQTIGFLDDL